MSDLTPLPGLDGSEPPTAANAARPGAAAPDAHTQAPRSSSDDAERKPTDLQALGEPAAEPGDRTPPTGTLGVILAAGAGTRFSGDGHKLLAPLDKRPLVWWATTHALAAGFSEVLVIEGPVPLSDSLPAEASVVRNDDWADGQARTLQVAVRYAATFGYDAIVVGVADQPFVPPQAWRTVANATAPIAVAKFAHGTTPPVRLDADVWGLLPIDGDEGARQLLRSRPELVTEVPCPGSDVDVDTVSSLDRVRRDPLRKEMGSWT